MASRQSLRARLSFANVISLIALFVALGGTAYAVQKNSVGTAQLKDGAVTAAKVRSDTLTGGQIKESALGTVPSAAKAAKLADGGLRASALGPITTVTRTSDPLASNDARAVTVQCPAGTRIISGGGDAQQARVFTLRSRRSDPNGWRYDAYNGDVAASTITVYAYCLGA